MTTTLNNTDKVYLIVTDKEKILCNLIDIPRYLIDGSKIYRINTENKTPCLNKVSTRLLNELFRYHKIQFQIL